MGNCNTDTKMNSPPSNNPRPKIENLNGKNTVDKTNGAKQVNTQSENNVNQDVKVYHKPTCWFYHVWLQGIHHC